MPDLLLDRLRRRAHDETGPLPPVDLPPGDAVGHVLREELRALSDLPPTAIATVPGWAVAGPGPWQVLATRSAVEISAAGEVLPDGYAAEVPENGALPAGTTAVVGTATGLVEDGRLFGEVLLGDHVLAPAAEVAADTLLVPEGTLLTPGAAALAAAGGHPDVRVTAHPTVALLLAYGDTAGSALPGALDVTGALLSGLLRSTDAADVATRRVPDSGVGLRSTIDATRADLVVVTSGLRGERARHLDAVLADARADVAIDGAVDGVGLIGASSWLMARLRDGRVLVALPGDVRSAAAGLLALVRPAIRAMAGFDLEELASRTVDVDVRSAEHGTSFVFLRGGTPTPDVGPATGHGVAGADALAAVPPLGVSAGGSVDVLPLT